MSEESEKTEETTEESVNKLSRPPVFDMELFRKPISEEAPSGEYLRYATAYDEIGEARRADMDVDQGDWQVDLKVADFDKVVELASGVLAKETKDIQIAAWFCEALTKIHGFAGLRDSLKLMSMLQETFWDTLHPEIEEGDMEGRANALAWVDEQTAMAIMEAPITEGEGYGLFGYEDSKRFDFPEDVDSLTVEERAKVAALKERAAKENRVTAEKWARAIVLSKRAFYEELNVAIEECWAEHKNLNRVIEEQFDPKQAPGLPEIRKALDSIQTRTDKLLAQKREEEPDPADEEEGSDGASASGKGNANSGGRVQNRKDALRKLAELATFFRRTEPHSPVSYLVTRAVKWGNMPFDKWLEDVIKDQNVMSQVRQTLGFNTESSEPEPAVDAGTEEPPAE